MRQSTLATSLPSQRIVTWIFAFRFMRWVRPPTWRRITEALFRDGVPPLGILALQASQQSQRACRRVTAGRETPRPRNENGHLSHGAEEYLFYGNECRERYSDGRCGHYGSTNLFRQHGSLHDRGKSADEFRPRAQSLHMANDEIHGRDGASGFYYQRFYQARLEGSFLFCDGCGCRAHSRDPPHDRLRMSLQRCTRNEPEEGDREAPQLDPELRGHGRVVHRQDGNTHGRPRRAHAPLQCRWA